MPAPAITSAAVGGITYTVGQRVCIVGHGSANLVHRHATVARFTRTMMVVEYTFRRREASGVHEITGRYRYRTGDGVGREVGAYDWGGSSVAPRCQRPKPTTQKGSPS